MLWCLGPASAFAADYTFTGKAMAPHNEDWSQAENWDPTNGPPGDGDTVTIGTSDNGFFVNVDSAVTVESVTVISSILQGGGSLSVSGDMECLYAQLMPGGGITPANVQRIVAATGVTEVHLSARRAVQSGMTHRNPRVFMGGALRPPEFSWKATDSAAVRSVVQKLRP